ncbi:Probable E3 ubiquitin-protein ligase HERC4 [Eumeta japonica]|uniref:HECT-type E3 ubiquitin transferase n=1 Tax=Eumeta variegata TaxID=151549 RepID=A0A4C1YJG8_EUMVA|nr:Probable E3 ubiquitin-protein ligase HERC4 [Eumeta japonica]
MDELSIKHLLYVDDQVMFACDLQPMVCGGRIIKLFRSHELMAVVMGNEEYDWEVFESNAEYKNGYLASDQQIRWFWEVFHELSLEEKKKFLLFLTGSDRVPILGMKDIKIRFQPVADDKYYPVAHTCFNLLDLPRYKTKERLKYYLLQSIQQTQGFSLHGHNPIGWNHFIEILRLPVRKHLKLNKNGSKIHRLALAKFWKNRLPKDSVMIRNLKDARKEILDIQEKKRRREIPKLFFTDVQESVDPNE